MRPGGVKKLAHVFLKINQEISRPQFSNFGSKTHTYFTIHTETEASVLTHFVFRNFSLIPHWDLVYVLPNESEDCLGFRALVTKKAEEQRDTGKRKEPKI